MAFARLVAASDDGDMRPGHFPNEIKLMPGHTVMEKVGSMPHRLRRKVVGAPCRSLVHTKAPGW